jgi:hypothetical protein
MHVVEVRPEHGLDRDRQHRDAILAALAVADHDLVRSEVDIFHAQPAALQQAEASTVEQERHDPRHAGQLLENRPGLLACEHDGQVLRALGPHDIIEPRQLHAEHVSIQEEQGTECLVLGGRGDLVSYGERGQECRDLGRPHLGRMPLAVEEDEPPDPVNVGFLGPATVVPGADRLADAVQEAGPGRRGRARLAHEPRRRYWRLVQENCGS